MVGIQPDAIHEATIQPTSIMITVDVEIVVIPDAMALSMESQEYPMYAP